MAGRPIKRSLDYAGWSVNIFDSDTKIDELLDAQGWTGFGVYFYLCQRAYGSDGYFYRWSYADAATTARKMGGGVGSETVKQAVGTCLQIGLFEKRLFDRDGILTGRGIQKRYWAAISDRPRALIIPDAWLLSEEESPGVIKFMQKSNCSPTNGNLLPNNTDFYPLKKRKEKKRKENDSADDVLDVPVTDMIRQQELQDWIENRLSYHGIPASRCVVDEAVVAYGEYGKEAFLEALKITADAGAKWPYAHKVLRNRAKGAGPSGAGERKPKEFN